MTGRLPWFRCNPEKLIGAITALPTDAGYLYVLILLRIYETGGPISDTTLALGRRLGMSEKRAAAAIEILSEEGKIIVGGDRRIDSASTHEELAHQREARKPKVEAGKASAAKRAAARPENRPKIDATKATEKAQQNQQPGPTVVQLPLPDTRTRDREGGDKPLPNRGQARATYPANAFEAFWRRYPNRVAEPVARAAFDDVVASDLVSFDDLMAGLEAYCMSKPRDRKWLNPATFLRDGRWGDEPAVEDVQIQRGQGLSQLAARKASGDGTAYFDPFSRYDRSAAGAGSYGGGNDTDRQIAVPDFSDGDWGDPPADEPAALRSGT